MGLCTKVQYVQSLGLGQLGVLAHGEGGKHNGLPNLRCVGIGKHGLSFAAFLIFGTVRCT